MTALGRRYRLLYPVSFATVVTMCWNSAITPIAAETGLAQSSSCRVADETAIDQHEIQHTLRSKATSLNQIRWAMQTRFGLSGSVGTKVNAKLRNSGMRGIRSSDR